MAQSQTKPSQLVKISITRPCVVNLSRNTGVWGICSEQLVEQQFEWRRSAEQHTYLSQAVQLNLASVYILAGKEESSCFPCCSDLPVTRSMPCLALPDFVNVIDCCGTASYFK